MVPSQAYSPNTRVELWVHVRQLEPKSLDKGMAAALSEGKTTLYDRSVFMVDSRSSYLVPIRSVSTNH